MGQKSRLPLSLNDHRLNSLSIYHVQDTRLTVVLLIRFNAYAHFND